MIRSDEKILKIKELMKDRNYQEFACTYDGLQNVISMEFKSIPNYSYDHVFTCIIYPHDSGIHEFEFIEMINPGALLLSSNKCGPLDNDKLFTNQEYFMLRALRRFNDNSNQ